MPKSPRSNWHKGTSVRFPDGQTIVFQEQLSRVVAIKRALKARKSVQNPVEDPVAHAMERFEEFNNKPPTELVKLSMPDLRKMPLINIGKVPEIHYTSRKEGGKPIHYVHFLKKKGTLYAHPDGGLFVTLAPSTTVSDWLRENPAGQPVPVFRSTEQAKEFGRDATQQEKRELSTRREKHLEESRQAKERGDIDGAIRTATAAQFDREALEAGISNKSLIAENIEKARARYEALSPEARSKVKNQRSWVMKVAWQIQRGRIKGYGHK